MPSHTEKERAKGRRKLVGSGHEGTHRGRSKLVSKSKAKKILQDGSIRGKKLTEKQRGFFGARAGGAPVRVRTSA